MDKRGAPFRPNTVQYMANVLLANRGSKPPLTVGRNWVTTFIKRHDILKTRFARKYDYKRALCEDVNTIRGWFERVRQTIEEWGITDEDIYNFDETGFALGIIATAKVFTSSDR